MRISKPTAKKKTKAPAVLAKAFKPQAKPAPVAVNPRPSRRTDEDGADFLPVTWEIDSLDPVSKRPFTGEDIPRFRGRHKLSVADQAYALHIVNTAKLAKLTKLPVLPYTLEVLLRLYDHSPSPAPWTVASPATLYRAMYGKFEDEFAGDPLAGAARSALHARFGATIGRSLYASNRWIDSGGKSKSYALRIFAKLGAEANPRQVIEGIARTMFAARGADFDLMFPLPTRKNPPVLKTRGPRHGSTRRTSEEAAQAKAEKKRLSLEAAERKAELRRRVREARAADLAIRSKRREEAHREVAARKAAAEASRQAQIAKMSALPAKGGKVPAAKVPAKRSRVTA